MKKKTYVRAISVIMCAAALAAFITAVVLVFMEDLYPIWAWFHNIDRTMISAFATSMTLAVIGAALSWLLERM